jgi:hypothetical protein
LEMARRHGCCSGLLCSESYLASFHLLPITGQIDFKRHLGCVYSKFGCWLFEAWCRFWNSSKHFPQDLR